MSFPIPCQCCRKELPPTWHWFICDKCAYRVCPDCLPKHRGRYASGGQKCSQCAQGTLASKPG